VASSKLPCSPADMEICCETTLSSCGAEGAASSLSDCKFHDFYDIEAVGAGISRDEVALGCEPSITPR
jgi:hypothetical protein